METILKLYRKLLNNLVSLKLMLEKSGAFITDILTV